VRNIKTGVISLTEDLEKNLADLGFDFIKDRSKNGRNCTVGTEKQGNSKMEDGYNCPARLQNPTRALQCTDGESKEPEVVELGTHCMGSIDALPVFKAPDVPYSFHGNDSKDDSPSSWVSGDERPESIAHMEEQENGLEEQSFDATKNSLKRKEANFTATLSGLYAEKQSAGTGSTAFSRASDFLCHQPRSVQTHSDVEHSAPKDDRKQGLEEEADFLFVPRKRRRISHDQTGSETEFDYSRVLESRVLNFRKLDSETAQSLVRDFWPDGMSLCASSQTLDPYDRFEYLLETRFQKAANLDLAAIERRSSLRAIQDIFARVDEAVQSGIVRGLETFCGNENGRFEDSAVAH
jgi:hypothetical protein